jgi:hypothetical protein
MPSCHSSFIPPSAIARIRRCCRWESVDALCEMGERDYRPERRSEGRTNIAMCYDSVIRERFKASDLPLPHRWETLKAARCPEVWLD